MKKSYQKLLVFDLIIVVILLLNSLILSILSNYYYLSIFLMGLIIIFKLVFGIEKDNHRYVKDIIIDITILYLSSFIIYYLFGLIIGFTRTNSYYTWYGLKTFIIPAIIIIILKEYLRYQMLNKVEKSKILTVVTCLLFIYLDIGASIANQDLAGSYGMFLYFALTVLPTISNNIACTYIARKVGYKPNIFWYLIASLYAVLLPIIPNTGLYIGSIIEFLFPYAIVYTVYIFFEKRAREVPIKHGTKYRYISLGSITIVTCILAYFVSGYFRYYAVAIGSGSMTPNIYKGDVVIIDQAKPYQDLQIGEVIAYRKENLIIVHRLVDIVKVEDDYYFYTKGDANLEVDNYVIYPDTILGTVNHKIPYIGLPTVWLSEL